MKRVYEIISMTVMILILWNQAGAEVRSASFMADPVAAIAADYQAGRLSLDEKAILQITAIKNPDDLPAEYHLRDSLRGRSHTRGITSAIAEIVSVWDQLRPETQASLAAMLARPVLDTTYRAPSGFFLLHYDTTGEDAVSLEDLDLDGVPDYIERCASYCDTALATHIGLDYRLPPSDNGLGGDTALDVYFEEMPYYGYAVPEGQGAEPWNDYFSYLVLHRDYIGFPPNNDPDGDIAGAAKATAAHEFHHCVQFAYDASEPPWFQELDATYMEDIVFDLTDDNYNYLPSFMGYPEKSLMESSLHMYASFLWGVFLAERFDTSLMVSVWEGARFDDVYSALSDTLLADYGWTQDSAFAEFTVWNYITGQRDDGNHYQEGSAYPAVVVADTYASYPRLNILSPEQPAGYGACYIQFRPGISVGNLRLTFTGSLSRTWAAYVIKSSAGNVHQPEKMAIDGLTQSGSLDIHGFENYESVTLIGINLDEFTGGASFNCGAEIVGDHAVSSVLLTDSMVYAGVARDFEYEVINISPINDVYRVTAWDDSGWIASIMVDRFIAAGESSIVDIPVSPIAGTPLGSSSTLFFRATSLNNTDVWHEVNGTAYTVLQRGDADFDGLVDIGDLTHLIGFLFIEGPEPLPIPESGNFDCEGIVDIGDLTRLIQYLFQSEAGCPCNPF